MIDRKGFGVVAAGAGACLLVGAWLLLGGGGEAGDGQRRPFVLPVRLATVERRDVQPNVRLTGTVRARQRARLGFEVTGVVSELLAQEADRVEAGQVLARLESRDQALVVEARGAELSLADLELQKLEAGPRVETKRRLQAELDVARANADLAAQELARGRSLLARDVLSQADVDRLVAVLEAAQARVAAAAAEVAEAKAGSRTEDLAIAQAAVERARATHQIAERELEKTSLVAPWAGAVVSRRVSVGAHVAAGEAVFELIDPERLEVAVEIPARYAARLGSGAPVALRLDELPDFALDAELSATIPVADELSRNFVGLIRLEPATVRGAADREPVLKPGMFVRLDLELTPVRGQLVVPTDAVRVTDKGPVVVTAVPAPAPADASAGGAAPGQGQALVAQWVPVRILGADASGTAVESLGPPLEVGAAVVVTGVDLAFPGASLMPRPEPSPGEPAETLEQRDAGAGK